MTMESSSASNAPVIDPSSTGNVFVRAWRGQESLPVVWWGFGIPLKVVSWAANSRWAYDSLYGKSGGTAIVVWLTSLAAYVVLSIMVWRCAPNTKEKGWKWIARGLVVAGWLWLVYQLVTPGAASVA